MRHPASALIRGPYALSKGIFFSVCIVLAAGLVILAVVDDARAAQTTVQAETMPLSGSYVYVRDNTAASGGKEVSYFTNGSASSSFDGAATEIALRGRGTACQGNPRLKVYVDDALKGTVYLTSDTFANYTLALSGLSAGTHTLRVSFDNDFYAAFTCDRNAYLDSYTLTLPSTTLPACDKGSFLAQYRNELRTFNTQPVLSRCESTINFDWGSGSPGSGVNVDSFTARWVGSFAFEASTYEFSATADDGVRLWVDGQLLIDQWKDQGATTYKATKTMSAGTHEVKVKYYEYGGLAVAKTSWAKAATPPPPDTTPPETTITDGPAEGSTTTQADVPFSFSSSEANSAFGCQLDGGGFSSCTSPKTLSKLSNGSHTFEVQATDAAGNTDATPARRTWTVNATTQSGTDPVMVGAGDIANCSNLAGAEATAKLLDTIPGTVYTLGDNAYGSGTSTEFANCYDPTWGRHMARTRPAPGNHEYYTAGASGYFNYFGPAAGDPKLGYYSYDLGQWHVVVLNTNDQCKYVSCSAGSAQANWLQADLADHPAQCTLAYFHYPLFTSGSYSPGISAVKPLWDVLYSGGADVVLNGHDHLYERFAPQSPSGVPDPGRGIREFVVGTGGAEHYGIKTAQPTSEVRNTDTYGVLKLTLHASSYDWQFVPVAGKTFTDSGSTSCH
jgi:hypothetical protein